MERQNRKRRTESTARNVVDIVAVSGVKLIVKVDPQMAKVTGNLPQSQLRIV